MLYGFADQALAQVLRPMWVVVHAAMLQVLHRQDQRGGRVALGYRADDFDGIGQAATQAALAGGNGQGLQAVLMQAAEIVVGELAAAVVLCGARGEFAAQLGQQHAEGMAAGLGRSAGGRPGGVGKQCQAHRIAPVATVKVASRPVFRWIHAFLVRRISGVTAGRRKIDPMVHV
ncbi:hypothetical protein D3C81_1085900 [compost metagenome]